MHPGQWLSSLSRFFALWRSLLSTRRELRAGADLVARELTVNAGFLANFEREEWNAQNVRDAVSQDAWSRYQSVLHVISGKNPDLWQRLAAVQEKLREPYAKMFAVHSVDLTQLSEQLRKAVGIEGR